MISVVNLVTDVCEPQYATMVLVRYGASPAREESVVSGIHREEIERGAVGMAFGRLDQELTGNRPFDVNTLPPSFGTSHYPQLKLGVETTSRAVVVHTTCRDVVSHHIPADPLRRAGDHVHPARVYDGWVDFGNVSGWGMYMIRMKYGICSRVIRFVAALVYGVDACGGFLLVIQMMLSVIVCTVI